MEAFGELVEDSLSLLCLPTEHQGLEEAPGRKARLQDRAQAGEPAGTQAGRQSYSSLPRATTSQLSLLPREGLEALPEGSVQALASKLEEGQVFLSHSPTEVIAAERI